MKHLNHKIRILAVVVGLFALCLMSGCEQESNKFKMNDGMQFKETEKSIQEATGNNDNGQEGKNKNPDKKGTAKEEETVEELSTQVEETSEEDQSETESQKEEETENQTEKQTEKESSKTQDNKEGDKKDDNKKGDKEGGSGNGDTKYTPDYNGETLEIYVDIEDE